MMSRSSGKVPGIAFAATLLLASAALAESDTNPPAVQATGDQQPAAREGNVFDHRDHQPTQEELQSRGIAPPGASSQKQIDKEVQELLKQASPTGSQAR